jgi:tetratricopeptide (TPR) repeat protein
MADERDTKKPSQNSGGNSNTSSKASNSKTFIRFHLPKKKMRSNSLFKKDESLYELAEHNKNVKEAYQYTLKKALKYYQTVVKSNPTHCLTLFQIATIQDALDEHHEAIKHYSIVISLLKKNPDKTLAAYLPHAYSNRGILRQKLNNLVDAEKDFHEAIKLGANFHHPYFSMAVIKEDETNFIAAKKYYTNALKYVQKKDTELKNSIIKSLDSLNNSILNHGDDSFGEENYLQAISCYTKFINQEEMPSKYPTIFYNRAKSRYALLVKKRHNDADLARAAKEIKDDIEKAVEYGLAQKDKDEALYFLAFAECTLENHTKVLYLYDAFKKLKGHDKGLIPAFEMLCKKAQRALEEHNQKFKNSPQKLANLSKPPENHQEKYDNESTEDSQASTDHSTNTSDYETGDETDSDETDDDDTPDVPSYSTFSPRRQKS